MDAGLPTYLLNAFSAALGFGENPPPLNVKELTAQALDVLNVILLKTDAKTVVRWTLTCKHLYNVFNEDVSLWRTMVARLINDYRLAPGSFILGQKSARELKHMAAAPYRFEELLFKRSIPTLEGRDFNVNTSHFGHFDYQLLRGGRWLACLYEGDERVEDGKAQFRIWDTRIPDFERELKCVASVTLDGQPDMHLVLQAEAGGESCSAYWCERDRGRLALKRVEIVFSEDDCRLKMTTLMELDHEECVEPSLNIKKNIAILEVDRSSYIFFDTVTKLRAHALRKPQALKSTTHGH